MRTWVNRQRFAETRQWRVFAQVSYLWAGVLKSPYPGSEKDIVLTAWCPRSNRFLVSQFSANGMKGGVGKKRGNSVWQIHVQISAVARTGVRVPPFEVVFRNGAEIFAWAPKKRCVQASTGRARESDPDTDLVWMQWMGPERFNC